jgi:hypothetical protein
MEDNKIQPEEKIKIERVFGIILLLPPLLSVILFTVNLFSRDAGNIVELRNLSAHWTGSYDNGGYTSAAPIYLGLMAIAGALLLKSSKN